MAEGIIRLQADRFPELADCLVKLALPGEGDAQIVVSDVIILRHLKRMPEEGFTALPLPELLPRQRKAGDHRRRDCCRGAGNPWARHRFTSSPAPHTRLTNSPISGT